MCVSSEIIHHVQLWMPHMGVTGTHVARGAEREVVGLGSRLCGGVACDRVQELQAALDAELCVLILDSNRGPSGPQGFFKARTPWLQLAVDSSYAVCQ